MATKDNRVQLLCIFDAFLMGEAWSSLHYEMGSLGKDLCHRRTPTGSVFFLQNSAVVSLKFLGKSFL